MNGQMLLFGEEEKRSLNITRNELEAALGAGSNFAKSKERIRNQILKREGLKADADFLKKEYGIGGRNFAIGGRVGTFLNYNGSGMTFSDWKDKTELHLSWVDVAKIIQRLVFSGNY